MQNLRVPYLGENESEVFIVWDSLKESEPLVADYEIFLNGKRLEQTAAQNVAETNEKAFLACEEFYKKYGNVRTDICFYKIGNLESNAKYAVQVFAVGSDGKKLAASEKISVRTAAASAVLSVADLGAVPGDVGREQIKANTKAIQKAIDDCPKNGTVLIPKGKYVSGSLWLKSDMTLRIDGELSGSVYAEDYDFGFLMYKYYTDKRFWGILNIDGAKNVRIVGKGTVNGNGWKIDKNGNFFHSKNDRVFEDGILAADCMREYARITGDDTVKNAFSSRSTMVLLRNVEGLFIEGLTFTNPANHTVNIIDSKNVTVTGIKELSYDCSNGDGIGFICSQNGIFYNNYIDTGDDSIVFSAGVGNAATTTGENGASGVRIFGNYIAHGHGGVAFGSHTALGINDVIISDNIFCGTQMPFRIKSSSANGGEVYDVEFKNNVLAKNRIAFTMSTDYKDAGTVSAYGASEKMPSFHEISIHDNIVFDARNMVSIVGIEENPHKNIELKNIKFVGCMGGIDFESVENVKFTNVTWDSKNTIK